MGILVLKLTKGYQQSNQEIPGKLSIVVPTAHLERYRSGKDSSSHTAMIPGGMCTTAKNNRVEQTIGKCHAKE